MRHREDAVDANLKFNAESLTFFKRRVHLPREPVLLLRRDVCHGVLELLPVVVLDVVRRRAKNVSCRVAFRQCGHHFTEELGTGQGPAHVDRRPSVLGHVMTDTEAVAIGHGNRRGSLRGPDAVATLAASMASR